MAFRNGKQHLQVAINDGTPRYIAMAKSETGSPWQKANPLRAVAKAEIQYEAAASVPKNARLHQLSSDHLGTCSLATNGAFERLVWGLHLGNGPPF